MTSGTTQYGTVGQGTYVYKQWSGGDRVPGESYDVEHAYSMSSNRSKLIPVLYKSKLGSNWKSGSMLLFVKSIPYYTADPPINECTNKVQGKLLQSNFNLGVFAGEFRETVIMLSRMVRGVARGIRYAKKGQLDRALQVWTGGRRKSIPGLYAETHLLFTYGLIPLLKDIVAAYDYLRTNYEVVSVVKASVVKRKMARVTLNSALNEIHSVDVYSIRGKVVAQVSELDRLGLTDPASVAWELTRLSFVYDWLVPVGNFLQAVNASRGTAGSYFWTTRFHREEVRPIAAPTSYDVVPWDTEAYREVVNSYNRSHMTSLPWKFPTIQNPLGDSYGRYISSVALLRQVAK